MLENILLGVAGLFTVKNMIVIVLGMLCGIVIGSIPGLTPDLAIILCVPLTYSMEPITGILMCLGLYCGGTYGGSIAAILINTPGTPANAATILDGYPLTRQGKALKALQMALFASFVGGIISAIVLLFLSPQIAKVTLMFGPPEYLAVAIFGLSIIAGVSGGNVFKGFIGGALGLFISCIGTDTISSTLRFTFGINKMSGGIQLIIALLGLFALSELITNSAYHSSRKNQMQTSKIIIDSKKTESLTITDIKRCMKTIITGSFIGTLIGATPGTGGGIAAFISYDQARKSSQNRENFGKGELEGMAASESANNGTTGATLIPLLTLGVPGDGVTAILLGALMLQGLIPGPTLFTNQAQFVYAIMLGLILINFIMLVIGYLCTPLYTNITKLPYELMSALIVVYCMCGAYSNATRVFDVVVSICFGIVGYFLRKMDFSLVPVLLGIVLGQTAETNMRRSLALSSGSVSIFFKRPICLTFLLLAAGSLVLFFYKDHQDKRRKKQEKINKE